MNDHITLRRDKSFLGFGDGVCVATCVLYCGWCQASRASTRYIDHRRRRRGTHDGLRDAFVPKTCLDGILKGSPSPGWDLAFCLAGARDLDVPEVTI